MKLIVLDSEGDGLAHHTTKLHNLCTTQDGKNFFFTTDYEEMKEELLSADLLVCHNIHTHDRPAFKKVLGIDIPWEKSVDTLLLSYNLFPDRAKHGLESWGEEVGIQKVKVSEDQWADGDYELMKSRVTEDVKINWKVWEILWKRLGELYTTDEEKWRHIKYLSLKGDCVRVQQENPLKVDRPKAIHYFNLLDKMHQEKKDQLQSVMPKVPILKSKSKPKVMTKKDGSLSAAALKWYEFLEEQCLPEGTEGPVNYIEGYKEPNAGSDQQLKEWLFSLGWKPCTYKSQRNKVTGDVKKIPQVRYFSPNDPRKGELTESVLALCEVTPELEALDQMTMLSHRRGLFKGFVEATTDDNWYVAQKPNPKNFFTNTMRFNHSKPFANMPKADGSVPWGVEIRSCIIAPEGKVMCGSDVISLESTTKRHYMYPHDPSYVEEMGKEGFDEHLDLAVHAGAVTQEDVDLYNEFKDNPTDSLKGLIKEVKTKRKQYKATNYSSIYGVGKDKLASELFIKVSAAEALLKAYWDRNWSIKKVVKEQYVKTLKDGTMWLKNPVSGMYYKLRFEKDIFSTLNQGTGVFIFDCWLSVLRSRGVTLNGQYHDEVFFYVDGGEEVMIEGKLKGAMDAVNKHLKLNVDVGVDVQFGLNYSEVH